MIKTLKTKQELMNDIKNTILDYSTTVSDIPFTFERYVLGIGIDITKSIVVVYPSLYPLMSAVGIKNDLPKLGLDRKIRIDTTSSTIIPYYQHQYNKYDDVSHTYADKVFDLITSLLRKQVEDINKKYGTSIPQNMFFNTDKHTRHIGIDVLSLMYPEQGDMVIDTQLKSLESSDGVISWDFSKDIQDRVEERKNVESLIKDAYASWGTDKVEPEQVETPEVKPRKSFQDILNSTGTEAFRERVLRVLKTLYTMSKDNDVFFYRTEILNNTGLGNISGSAKFNIFTTLTSNGILVEKTSGEAHGSAKMHKISEQYHDEIVEFFSTSPDNTKSDNISKVQEDLSSETPTVEFLTQEESNIVLDSLLGSEEVVVEETPVSKPSYVSSEVKKLLDKCEELGYKPTNHNLFIRVLELLKGTATVKEVKECINAYTSTETIANSFFNELITCPIIKQMDRFSDKEPMMYIGFSN